MKTKQIYIEFCRKKRRRMENKTLVSERIWIIDLSECKDKYD